MLSFRSIFIAATTFATITSAIPTTNSTSSLKIFLLWFLSLTLTGTLDYTTFKMLSFRFVLIAAAAAFATIASATPTAPLTPILLVFLVLNLRSGPSGRPNGDIVNLGSQFSYWFIDQARLNILPVTFSKFPPTGLSSLLSKLVSYHIFVIILICKAKNHVTEAGVNIGGGAKKVSHDLVISVFKGIVDLLQVALESFTLNGVTCTLAELSL